MQIIVNGQTVETVEGQTVAGLLKILQLEEGRVAVELDGLIVRQPEWATRTLRVGAKLEIVHFVGGG